MNDLPDLNYLKGLTVVLEKGFVDSSFVLHKFCAKASQTSKVYFLCTRKSISQHESLQRRNGNPKLVNVDFYKQQWDNGVSFFNHILYENPSGQFTVIVDDFSIFYGLNVEQKSIFSCLSNLLKIAGCKLILGVRQGSYHEFLSKLIHLSKVVISVESIPSGKSKDADGKISYLPGPFHDEQEDSSFLRKEYHYKIIENSLRLMPLGLTSGFL